MIRRVNEFVVISRAVVDVVEAPIYEKTEQAHNPHWQINGTLPHRRLGVVVRNIFHVAAHLFGVAASGNLRSCSGVTTFVTLATLVPAAVGSGASCVVGASKSVASARRLWR